MRVLEVLDDFYPDVDGPIEVIVSVARTFNNCGFGEMELLVPKYPEIVEVEGLKIHRCFSVSANETYRAAVPQLDRKIKKIIKNGKFDVIHIHSPFTLGKYALKLGHKYKIPVIFTMHTKFRDEFERRLKSKLLRKFMMGYIMKCINGCDCVTTVSHGTVDTLAEYGYKAPQNVKVICNATSMPPLSADGEVTARIRRELGLENAFAFAYVGRLAKTKNIDFSIKVLAEVKKRGYGNFRFVIVGDGDHGKALKKQVEALSLSENVVFVGKVTDKKLLASYYSACDALLFPSAFDNASIVILEAAANGLPAVTLKGSCSAERIEDGVSGFVWENDENSWVDGVINLLNNPEAAKTAGEGAVARVYAGWEDITREYLKLYESLISQK